MLDCPPRGCVMTVRYDPLIDDEDLAGDAVDPPGSSSASPPLQSVSGTFSLRWVRWSIALLITAAVLRLIALSNVVLLPEEAYYWMYARHLSWGYFDHP